MSGYIVSEKETYPILSFEIAKGIIGFSKKPYGFKIVSRDTNEELEEDAMLGVLSVAVKRVLDEIGT